MEAKVWEGVENLLDQYAGVRATDQVVLLYTSDSYESAAWVSAALQLRRIPVHRVWMAPLRDDGFKDRLATALPDPGELAGRLVVLSFEKDTMSHTRALAEALTSYGRDNRVVLRAISSCSSLFADALSVSPQDLSARNAALLNRLLVARHLRITTPSGSHLDVQLDSERHRWISNRGSARPGGVVILPAGEVATFPAGIEGVFIADFAFNVNAITNQDARLGRHPVTVWIENGKAVKYECGDPDMDRFLDECFKTQCAVNVGELGFGTNFGIGSAIAMNSHINERRCGVHLGFGQHNQDPGVVNYQCTIHLDLIAQGGVIWIDDDPTPLDLEDVSPSPLAHPRITRDEDVFSPEFDDLEIDDCCGIMTSEGLRPFSRPT